MKKKILFLSVVMVMAMSMTATACVKSSDKASNSSPNVENQNVASINVEVKITFGDSNDKNIKVEAAEGSTAYDLLQQATTKDNIALDVKESAGIGKYVNSIGDKKAGDEGKYWLYYINNEPATQAIDKQAIKNNDVIEFKFTKS